MRKEARTRGFMGQIERFWACTCRTCPARIQMMMVHFIVAECRCTNNQCVVHLMFTIISAICFHFAQLCNHQLSRLVRFKSIWREQNW